LSRGNSKVFPKYDPPNHFHQTFWQVGYQHRFLEPPELGKQTSKKKKKSQPILSHAFYGSFVKRYFPVCFLLFHVLNGWSGTMVSSWVTTLSIKSTHLPDQKEELKLHNWQQTLQAL
jgi:hypothetical protein